MERGEYGGEEWSWVGFGGEVVIVIWYVVGFIRVVRLNMFTEFLKAGILGSRIPDIIVEESGHFRTIFNFPDFRWKNYIVGPANA